MPRSCSICTHDDREAIDAAIIEKEPYRNIAERYGLSIAAISRHSGDHLPQALTQAQEAQEIAHADTLLAQLDALRQDAARIGGKAEKAESYGAALGAIREQSRIIELLLKVAGELAQEGTVNIHVNAEWVELRTLILTALAPYPDARLAVARALEAEHVGA